MDQRIPQRKPRRDLAHYETLEYLLLGDLRDVLEEPLDDETRRWLTEVVAALLQTLPREFELEEQGGYLSEVLEEYPNWAPQVESLRSEHAALFHQLQTLHQELTRGCPAEELTDDVRTGLRDWIFALQAHNRHESRLLQTAVNLVCGGGD